MTMMGLDIEIIEHLDFDFEPPCENEIEPCDAAASWKVVLSCCGTTYLFCEGCKTALVNYFKVVSVVTHATCGGEDCTIMILEPL